MHLLIPAAGMGRRMGADRNKLLLTLLGQPLIAWTLKAIALADQITWVGLIGQPADFPNFQEILDRLNFTKPIALISGGDTRQESVFNGLRALPADASHVLIHDGARCLASPELFNRCADTLRTLTQDQQAGLIAAIPVKDTIKVVGAESAWIESTPDRHRLWAAQTPQGFAVKTILECHLQGQQQGWAVTDDAALFERCGLPVQVVPGEETNLKLTTPMDLTIAEFILQRRLEGQA